MKITRPQIYTIFALLFAFALLFFIWNYLHTGKLVVEANGNYTIQVETLDAKPVRSGSTRLAVSLHSGEYIVKIQSQRENLGTKRINIIGRKTTRYSFKTTQTYSSIEPVINTLAYGVSVATDSITYLDEQTKNIATIDASNSVRFISNQAFESVFWATKSSVGVAQDEGGDLYTIRSGTIKKVQAPIPNGVARIFTLTPSGTLVAIYRDGVYTYTGTAFKKVGTTSSKSPRIAASDSMIAIYTMTDTGEDGSPPIFDLFSFKGKVRSESLDIKSATWSPDGTQLLVTSPASPPKILNASLQTKYVLPSQNITSVAWLNTTTVLFSVDDALWSYDTSTRSARMLTSTVRGSITSITTTRQGGPIYVTTKSIEDATISRITPQKKANSELTKKMAIFFPQETSSCLVGYINYVTPTIIANPYVSDFADSCRSSLDYLLQTYDLEGVPVTIGDIIRNTD